ncbi:hypothetical protein BD410DRAFT_900726 [Rickenella mellea]|uniref:DUF6533 domain-containing protein n=1 Tax=Rickenella mellea TaxID=50990 RepID=A0A4Y7PTD2_9AGAM|nr:hypothetical protein BD410DRAFT_900726 [Rickenella mellea]
MSDSYSPEDVALLINFFQKAALAKRAFAAGAALVFYDYILTLPTEIAEIWNSKFSGAKVLFFLARYPFVISTVLEFALFFHPNPTDQVCQGLYYSWLALRVFILIGTGSIFALRTYAIFQKKLWILMVLGLLVLANIGVILYTDAFQSYPVAGTFGLNASCAFSDTGLYPKLQIVSRSLVLAFDTLVFCLTSVRTIRHTRDMKRAGLGLGLGYVMLRDGTLYFLFAFVISVADLIFYNLPDYGGSAGLVEGIGSAVTVVLINRLVLNLRQVSHRRETGQTLKTIEDEPEFATNSVLGNLGAPLRTGHEEDDAEEMSINEADDYETSRW